MKLAAVIAVGIEMFSEADAAKTIFSLYISFQKQAIVFIGSDEARNFHLLQKKDQGK